MKELFVSEIMGNVRKIADKKEQENVINLFIMRREEKEIERRRLEESEQRKKMFFITSFEVEDKIYKKID